MAARGGEPHAVEMITLEEFEARRAAARAAAGGSGDCAPTSKSNDMLTPPSPNSNALGPAAIPVGRPRTSKHIVELFQLVATLKFPAPPEFEFAADGRNGVQSFTARLKLCFPKDVDNLEEEEQQQQLPIKIIQGGERFASKKEAKEAVAEKGVEAINEYVKKLRHSTAADGNDQVTSIDKSLSPPTVSVENFIGKLSEFCTAQHLPQPAYQFYQITLQSFACTVVLHLPPPSPITAHHGATSGPTPQSNNPAEPQTFGSAQRAVGTKKSAKAAAARAALDHLRTTGILDRGTPPPRKRARAKSPPADITTDDLSRANVENIPPGLSILRAEARGQGEEAGEETEVEAEHSPTSPTHIHAKGPIARVHALKLQLGLSNMEYRLKAEPGTALFSGAAWFPEEPRLSGLRGPLGQVTAVYGKKNAKEEIARQVVAVLEALMEKRLGDLK